MRLGLASMIALLLWSIPAAALDDLPGWQSTRWGMTEEQVKAAIQSDGFQALPPTPRRGLGTRGAKCYSGMPPAIWTA